MCSGAAASQHVRLVARAVVAEKNSWLEDTFLRCTWVNLCSSCCGEVFRDGRDKDAHHLVVRTMASRLIESTATRSSLACDPWYIFKKRHMDQVDMEQR